MNTSGIKRVCLAVILPFIALMLTIPAYSFSKPSLVILTGADMQFSTVMLHPVRGGEVMTGFVKGTASFYGDLAKITIYDLPPGTYSQVHTKISRITLHGTHNGLDFSYVSSTNLNKNIVLDRIVSIDDAGYITVYVDVDVSEIFMYGNIELDPTDPANSNTIDRNIRAAFRNAFRLNV